MQIHKIVCSVFCLASLLAGCAATPNVRQVRPVEGDLSRYTGLQIVVDAGEIIRRKEGYDITAAELQREFMANVVASERYADVSIGTPPPGKSLEARLMIIDFNYVSGAARGTTGILAGRAVLHVTMTLKDNETGDIIGSAVASHQSSHGQGVFSPTTGRQITSIAQELSAVVTKRK